MKKFSNKLNACLVTLLVVMILFSSKVIGEDWIDLNSDEYISAWQVLTWSALLDIIHLRIHWILIIIIFVVLIISLCVVLKTKDEEKRKKRKKIWIIATFWTILLSIISDVIFWFINNMSSAQTVYWVPRQVIEEQHWEKSIYPENTIYSLPEPKASTINVIINLAQRIVPIITFIIWIISLIRISKTKDIDLKKKRIKNTIIVLSILIVFIVGISVAARFLND